MNLSVGLSVSLQGFGLQVAKGEGSTGCKKADARRLGMQGGAATGALPARLPWRAATVAAANRLTADLAMSRARSRGSALALAFQARWRPGCCCCRPAGGAAFWGRQHGGSQEVSLPPPTHPPTLPSPPSFCLPSVTLHACPVTGGMGRAQPLQPPFSRCRSVEDARQARLAGADSLLIKWELVQQYAPDRLDLLLEQLRDATSGDD